MKQILLKQYENLDLTPQEKFNNKIRKLNYKLSLCGRYATKNFYCKKEEHQGDRLIKTVRKKFYCEIRYCDCPECLLQRFARQIETFNNIERFWGLEKLWHFVIGFEPIEERDFKKNFSKHNKRFQYILNKYFEKLRKKGLNIEAVRVLDFSFKKDGYVYLHYHFGAIPKRNTSIALKIMQKTRKKMIKNMRKKTPFHIETFFNKNGGHPSKEGVLSYLAIRSVGMYKYNNTENYVYDPNSKKLIDSIKQKKYIYLKNILTQEEYLKSFYNKPFFVTIGGLPRPQPHGSNITDDIPKECKCCGELTRQDVRIEIIFDSIPPDIVQYPELKVQKIKITKNGVYKIKEI